MNLDTLIAPTDLRDYAKSQGWVLLKEAARDRLYVMSNPRFERRQLVFPMDTTAPDYAEAVALMVEKLAAMERRTPDAVVKSLLEVSDDALAFRVSSPRPEDRYLPLSFASEMVAGVQQLLLALPTNPRFRSCACSMIISRGSKRYDGSFARMTSIWKTFSLAPLSDSMGRWVKMVGAPAK